MLILLVAAAGALAMPLTVADVPQPIPAPPIARKVGETFAYSLNAVMTQSIAGKDAFGRTLDQTLTPTKVKGHEDISITKTSADDVTMHRLGSITAIVVGAKPVTKLGQGWTIVDDRGAIVRDSGKLGGLFLLPLPFLAGGAINAGNELKVGDQWSGKLGTKLYGMTARPLLQFTVTGQRVAQGLNVYTIEAVGTVPMKEPVMTAGGEPLGFATGTARFNVRFDYDRDNRRLVSMKAELRDTLHYAGPPKRRGGHVKDRQLCEISLDPSSIAGGAHPSGAADPAQGP